MVTLPCCAGEIAAAKAIEPMAITIAIELFGRRTIRHLPFKWGSSSIGIDACIANR
jgi:hypothetical protein